MQNSILVKPVMPTEDEWVKLLEEKGSYVNANPKIDVIIPVYKGLEETARCIYSVCDNLQNTSFRTVVINDRSPQAELVTFLEKIASLGLIELHTNDTNLGFVGTVNYGMRLHPDRDVILLNSDTEVYNNWIDRIVNVANSDRSIGTITPLSNNAEICSYPTFLQDNNFELEVDGRTLDKIAAKVNSGSCVDAPTGVGFCMYIKRQCLTEVGYFDEETFGRGYGEENDFCQRAHIHGYRNVVLSDTYVRHYGSTSFGKDKLELVKTATVAIEKKHPNYHRDVQEFIASDPLKAFRSNIDCERLKLEKRPLVCFVTHNWKGGTERHVQDLKKQLEDQQDAAVLILRPHNTNNNLLILDDGRYPNIGPFYINRDFREFANFLLQAKVSLVHVHHLIGAGTDLSDYLLLACRDAKVPYDFTVHDYYTLCPRIHLLDHFGEYCGEPDISSCDSCCASGNYLSSLGGSSVWSWRERNARFLAEARRVWAPNSDVKKRIERYFPLISPVVRVHPESSGIPFPNDTYSSGTQNTRKKVALLGAIGPHKGSKLLLEVAKVARVQALDMEFVVIGYCDRTAELEALGNVRITGAYQEAELTGLLSKESPDIVWMSSICPETHSFTLSEVLAAPYFPVSFDF
ncbi:glycosyltransferase, partial [Salmonella enterica subsp. enterica serovar Alachua]|nr:glycosyltransferase [Salmonella enterica subsp. enterica serovar Alachua]